MLWHRWHPGGLPSQPAHCAALWSHQLRPGGHPCGQVSAGVTRGLPTPTAHSLSSHLLSSGKPEGASLPVDSPFREPRLSSDAPPIKELAPPKVLRVLVGGGNTEDSGPQPPPALGTRPRCRTAPSTRCCSSSRTASSPTWRRPRRPLST